MLSPNDHVNCSQSTNDAFPTAFRIALINRLGSYSRTLALLRDAFRHKGTEFAKVLKMGRTHLQDAVPMSMGDEFHSFATNLDEELARIEDAKRLLAEVNMGAGPRSMRPGAIRSGGCGTCAPSPGSSWNWPRTWWKPLRTREPMSGFNEINLPRLQPGSSIMPGKVDPVIPEVVNQASFYVIGADPTLTLAASADQLQLNVMEPVLVFALFTSIRILENAVRTLRDKCVLAITANPEHTREMVLGSLGIVTLLSPALGYKQCSEIAREGFSRGKSIHEMAVLERKLITQETWDELFTIENLIHPTFIQGKGSVPGQALPA